MHDRPPRLQVPRWGGIPAPDGPPNGITRWAQDAETCFGNTASGGKEGGSSVSGGWGNTVKTAIGALGAIYARAVQRDELDVSPTRAVKLPTIRNSRRRFASPPEANALLAAVPERDRAAWATAFYAGLRRGELMALRWADVDLQAGTIDVHRSWNMEHGPGDTKNRDRRRVPIAAVLREHLAAARLRQAPGVELCFGRADGRPFRPDRLQERADEALDAAGRERLTQHDARHTFASLMIAARVNAKALGTYMGHRSIAMTYDR